MTDEPQKPTPTPPPVDECREGKKDATMLKEIAAWFDMFDRQGQGDNPLNTEWQDSLRQIAKKLLTRQPPSPAPGQANGAQMEAMREAFRRFISQAMTFRKVNTDEWVEWFENEAIAEAKQALAIPPTTSQADQPAVSLEKCALAAYNAGIRAKVKTIDVETAKAVLDAAKAQGVRFDYVD